MLNQQFDIQIKNRHIMKKQLLFFAMLLLPMVAGAETVDIDGIYYNLIPKGNAAEVTSNPNMYSGSVVIPETVECNGRVYSVSSIGGSAFNGCRSLTSVTIPNSVTSIGNEAFYLCSGLTSVTIPNGVNCIGRSAFDNCENLTSILLPNSVKSIGECAFRHCHKLIHITLPSNLTSIEDRTFLGCNSLISVMIPNSVTSIKGRMYDDDTSLPRFYGAFNGCSSLTSIIIPNSVTSIGNDAFCGCIALTSITIPNNVTNIGSFAFYDCSALASVTIGNSVTSIGKYAFKNCSSLTSLTIPNSVTSIGDEAFQNCSGLTSITIPNSVTSIGRNSFFRCSGLTSIAIGNHIELIGSAFQFCSELRDVYCYAETVPTTNGDAFDGSYIEYVTLHVPDSSINDYKTTIPWSSFKEVKGLEGATLPSLEFEKCATPTIAYERGELLFSCETEDVQFVSEVKVVDATKSLESRVFLPPLYQITVYATLPGYENSDIATATIGIRNGRLVMEGFSEIIVDSNNSKGDVNSDGSIDVADISAIISLMAGKKQ